MFSRFANASRMRAVLDGVASFALITASFAVVWTTWGRVPSGAKPQTERLPTEAVPLVGAAMLGTEGAPIAMLAFSDFQCPYCRRFALETLPVVRQKYVDRGILRIAYRHFPLQAVHSLAFRAAEAAECAAEQGRFWPLFEMFFRADPTINDTILKTATVAVRADAKGFEQCMAGPASERVQRDISYGAALSVTGTPTFFVGTIDGDGALRVTHRVTGAQTLATFDAIMADLVASIQKNVGSR
jgi:protein-disulfide isomerase